MIRASVAGILILLVAGCGGGKNTEPKTPGGRLENLGHKVTRGVDHDGKPWTAVTLNGPLTAQVWEDVRRLEDLTSLSLISCVTSDSAFREVGRLNSLRWLTIESARDVTAEGWQALTGAENLFSLRILHTAISAEGAEQIGRLQKLRKAGFGDCQLTDGALRGLAAARGLDELSLTDNPDVTDAGVGELSALTALKELGLGGTQVTDAGLRQVRLLTKLERLDLANTVVTDRGLAELSELAYLARVNLSGTDVTDVGLNWLKGLDSLASLDLSSTDVTDAGLQVLKGCKALSVLDLEDTKVTAEGVKAFAAAKPNCMVYRR